MKAIRVLIPLILTIAIIACIGWYLFIYDSEFTRDMLLQGARYFDSKGNRVVSAWFYDQAYLQAEDNDAIAIELADQHKSAGNYTKAEYTLSKAIADNPSAQLYIALCKTYVEQDKLLDAVNMLNSITNKNIKSEIDKIRPSAPTCSPDPIVSGTYFTQYITVTLSAEKGTLYANAKGEFPSLKTDLYKQGFTLVDGENTIYAVTVDENGLVSPAAIFGFTIGGVVEEVKFTDPAMEAAIRKIVSIKEGKPVFTNHLWPITDFTVPEDAKDLADLQYLKFLERLTIDNSVSGQLSSVAALSSLTELHIKDTAVSPEELPIIGNLPKLQKLTLNGCGLSTATGLEKAVNLVYLDLGNNTVRNISPLSKMAKLQELNLEHNAVNSLSELTALAALSRLNVSYNKLSTLAPICSTLSLKWLNADHNQLTELSGLEKLTALEYLSLSHNTVKDVTPLSSSLKLLHLNVSNNALTDIATLAALKQLEHLDFSYNQVEKLPEFPADSKLIRIDGSHNLLETLAPLKGLPYLNNVYMDYNEEIETVSELATCPRLIQVNVFGTKVKEVTALTSQSVIVNFNPVQED